MDINIPLVKCSKHDVECMLKTSLSTKQTFYVCLESRAKCPFFKNSNLKPITCPLHSDNYIRLRTLWSQDQASFFRCNGNADTEAKWCGYYLKDGDRVKWKHYKKKNNQDTFEHIYNKNKNITNKNLNNNNNNNQTSNSNKDNTDQNFNTNNQKSNNNAYTTNSSGHFVNKINDKNNKCSEDYKINNNNKEKSVFSKENTIFKSKDDNKITNYFNTKESKYFKDYRYQTTNQNDHERYDKNYSNYKGPSFEKYGRENKKVLANDDLSLMKPTMPTKSSNYENYPFQQSSKTEDELISKLQSLKLKHLNDTAPRSIKLIEPLSQHPTTSKANNFYLNHWKMKNGEKDEGNEEVVGNLYRQQESLPSKQLETPDPGDLKISLFPYQRSALTWLLWREKQTPSGGIFADDMGLGKTLTIISLILKHKQDTSKQTSSSSSSWTSKTNHKETTEATLIITPLSVLLQWQSEVQRHTKSLSVCVYHGPERKSKSVKEVTNSDIVLTTYDIVRNELKNEIKPSKLKQLDELPPNTSILSKTRWLRIVLDEGHCIKNDSSATAQSIISLEGEFKWVVTGTPIHNGIKDLYPLIRFLQFSPFDDKKYWKSKIDNNSTKGFKRLELIRTVLVLRRTKEECCPITNKAIVDLPAKKQTIHKVTLNEQEWNCYQQLLELSKKFLRNYLSEYKNKTKNNEHHENKEKIDSNINNEKNKGCKMTAKVIEKLLTGRTNDFSNVLSLLTRLRQICCHPHLISWEEEANEEKEGKKESGLEDLMDSLNISAVKSKEAASSDDDIETTDNNKDTKQPNIYKSSYLSSKIRLLIENLLQLQRKSEKSQVVIKSVVVSQWTRLLDLVDMHLSKRGIRTCTIRGDTPVAQRNNIKDHFNHSPLSSPVMLLSLRAGAVGLNLVGANHLFILDLHWNPALEKQACDRIYRVGQMKETFIHKFVCKETVEEKILSLQEEKSKQADNFLTGSNNSSDLNSIQWLFGLSDNRSAPS